MMLIRRLIKGQETNNAVSCTHPVGVDVVGAVPGVGRLRVRGRGLRTMGNLT